MRTGTVRRSVTLIGVLCLLLGFMHRAWPETSILTVHRILSLAKPSSSPDQIVPLPAGGFLVMDIELLEQHKQSLEVFDSSGRFVRKIGKYGPGPGSYQALKSVAVARDGTIWVADLLGRLSFFDPQGRLLGTKLLQSPGFQVEGVVLDEARGFAYLSGCLPTKIYLDRGCRTIHQYA